MFMIYLSISLCIYIWKVFLGKIFIQLTFPSVSENAVHCCHNYTYYVLNHSVVSDSVTPWTVTHQAPLSMGFSRQEYWSGLTYLPPGDLPNPGIEPTSLMSSALVGGFFTTSATWEAPILTRAFGFLSYFFLFFQLSM